jgi:transposase
MGPTVWELDGPMPTVNKSKVLIAMVTTVLLYLKVRFRAQTKTVNIDPFPQIAICIQELFHQLPSIHWSGKKQHCSP